MNKYSEKDTNNIHFNLSKTFKALDLPHSFMSKFLSNYDTEFLKSLNFAHKNGCTEKNKTFFFIFSLLAIYIAVILEISLNHHLLSTSKK